MESHSIGKNLVYQRKRKGYTQEELSARTEVTVRTIQRIEKGDVNPHLQTIKLLATALDINVDDLLDLENPKEEAIQKKWLLLLHGTPLLGFILPFCNVLFPLFLWIHKREDNALYDKHGAKVVNFHITVLLLYVFSFIALLTIEKWGFIIFVSVIPLCVLIVLANIIYAVKSYKCYYPLSIPILRSKGRNAAKSFILLFALLVFTNCASQNTKMITRIDDSKITTTELSQKIQKLVDTANVTGITVSIFNQDTLAYQEAFGYANYDKKDNLQVNQVFYGASLSKSVFGYIVAHLVKDGVIDLDKPLQSYLDTLIPELYFEKEWRGFKNLKEDKRYEKITARMCLSHTTGFPNWRWISRIGEFQREGEIQIYSDPGTRYSYSGEGIRLLHIVIEKITGKGLEELARKIVFDPLKMDMTSYVWQPRFEGKYVLGHTIDQKTIPKDTEDEAGAAGSMETTPVDYSKFLEHILALESQDSPITELLFSPNIEIKSKMQFGPQSLETTTENEKIGLNYGMAWGLITKTPYGKAVFKEGHGEGFQHYSILFPEQNIGVLLMSNSDNAESIFKELLEITIGDVYTPWKWENYIPFNAE
ncbi:serine hydrolase [Maribacter halichondriae]|uniref:serine hydrolase n=1 Tax=Maribacter halichondriae TaxID=2980554 RepID=UPI002358C251|nr:serine hydrolase [Maribacter sp. Hal144]